MISKISSSISEKLCYANVIPAEEQALYSYGFFLLLSRSLFFVITFIFGFLFKTLWESIVFYVLFSLLRGYAGGVHASEEPVCMFFTTVLLFLASAFLHMMKISTCTAIAVGMLLIGGMVVFLLSPLDTEEKPLNPSERCYYRRVSRLITATMALAGSVAIILKIHGVLYVMSTCVSFEGVLLLIGQGKNMYLTHSKESVK